MENILPDTLEYEIQKSFLDNNNFEAVIRLKCKSEDELLKWKSDLEQKTGSNWIVRSTYPSVSKFIYRIDYVCQRSGHNKKVENGKVYCGAKMSFTVKKDTLNTRKHDDYVKRGFLSVVKILWCHNHQLCSSGSHSDQDRFESMDMDAGAQTDAASGANTENRNTEHDMPDASTQNENSGKADAIVQTDATSVETGDVAVDVETAYAGHETQNSSQESRNVNTAVQTDPWPVTDTGVQTDPSPVACHCECMEIEPCVTGQQQAVRDSSESIMPVRSSTPISEQRPAVTVGQTALFSDFSFAFVGMVESDLQKAALTSISYGHLLKHVRKGLTAFIGIIGKLGGKVFSHVERAKQRVEKTGGTVVGLADKRNHRNAQLFSSLYNITVIDMTWILHCFDKSELLPFTGYMLGR